MASARQAKRSFQDDLYCSWRELCGSATIRRNLEAQTEVKVVNDRKEAEAIFELLGQSRGSNVLAYNSDGRARIYSLRLTNTFRVVLQNGVELLPIDHGQRYPRIDSRRK